MDTHKRSAEILAGSTCCHGRICRAHGVCRPSNEHGINPGVRGGEQELLPWNTQPASALNTDLHHGAAGSEEAVQAARLLIHI